MREGELKLCKKVVVPQTGEEIDEMYENPDQLLASRTKKVDTFAETK